MPAMKIGINANLLSRDRGYRTAGIHGYIYNTLAHLHAAAPVDWQITAMVGAGNAATFDGITMRQASFSTDKPSRRVIWEQGIQPFALREFDLYHAMAFVSPLLLNRPSVVTVYDLSFIHYPQVLTPARRLYLRLFTALSCRRARRVIAISESTSQDLQDTWGLSAEKIDVAACGYDESQHHPLPVDEVERFRQEKGLPERFWLFLGTLEPRKNLTTLLDAYARLPAESRLPLILAGGKGWLYEAIFERVERYQLQDCVKFTGFVPAEELALWYNSAEVFILPSVFEGFGLPVLEAMACGTPVIVSNASSLPEVAGDAGMCLPALDVDAWVDALRQAKEDAEWRETARQQGFIEARRYSWRYTAEATIASYRQAMQK